MKKSPHRTHPWRVKFPAANGRRGDRRFRTETDALKFKKEVEIDLGQFGTNFGSPSEQEKSAILLWRRVVAEAEEGGLDAPSLLETVQEKAKTWRMHRMGRTVSGALQEFLEDREAEHASERHLQSLQSRLGRFERDFGSRTVGRVSLDDVESWLKGLHRSRGEKGKVSQVTRDNFRRSLLSFFNYCHQRKWIGEVPVPPVRRRKTRAQRLARSQAPGILAPADIARFVEALARVRMVRSGSEKDGTAVYEDHDNVSWWAIKIWAGLRDAEAARLDWKDVDLKEGEIHVRAEVSKTGDSRVVKIEPALRAWLEPRARRRGLVAPETPMKRRYSMLKALKILERDGYRLKLPHNWARHSFASYHLYHFGDPGQTALQLGHKGNPTMLHEHYKNPEARRDAGTFWEIRPAPPADNVTDFNQGVA